ncbi:cobalamin-binding protein [Heyndrickxia camelliae]|uniref:Cobalamin-binding protein n=1 Tax=Heyndrickxia camelliae TaxID=1707093 RepID=A0A2N3LH21_9BACI|nr:cobalamin-binding protein [Heyndrickxia camelliae]PKR83867.1 cobalamin-binding protein [Heyndrickxia camelliae]
MRVISICPSNTELLAYLDSLYLLVGIDDFSDWPETIQSLPKLGPDLSIRMDDLEALKPDLVLASLSVPGMEKNVEELKNRNIPHIVLNPQSLHDIADDLVKVGAAIGQSERGKIASGQFLQELEKYGKISSAIPQPYTLYWEWWPKPVFTPGRINWLTEVSQFAGGQNVYADIHLASVQTDWQDVFKRDPDYICLAWVGIQQAKVNPNLVKKRPHWETMRAVQNNHILVLEESLYCRPSPRLLTGINRLGKLLHPKYYADIQHDSFRR